LLVGREGYACVDCVDGFYHFKGECNICPEGSFPLTMLVITSFCLFVIGIYKCCGMSVYTSGTAFLQEIRPGDKISVKIPWKRRPVQRIVKRVNHDYLLMVNEPFGNQKPIIKTRFRFV